ncbi:MAG: hypothetical protein LBO05_07040, partial [Deltaproteobacteria bacterium]|nr:hypothetical protein [Deltaproteobacteria bacterium]
MKKILLTLAALALVFPLALSAAEENKTEEEDASQGGVVRGGVRSIVSGIVSTGKDAVVGVSEGITEGRRG